MDDDSAPKRGLGPLAASLAFAVGGLLALYGATAFGTHIYQSVAEFDRLVFADVFVPALAFVAGSSVAFSAAVAAYLRVGAS